MKHDIDTILFDDCGVGAFDQQRDKTLLNMRINYQYLSRALSKLFRNN